MCRGGVAGRAVPPAEEASHTRASGCKPGMGSPATAPGVTQARDLGDGQVAVPAIACPGYVQAQSTRPTPPVLRSVISDLVCLTHEMVLPYLVDTGRMHLITVLAGLFLGQDEFNDYGVRLPPTG